MRRQPKNAGNVEVTIYVGRRGRNQDKGKGILKNIPFKML